MGRTPSRFPRTHPEEDTMKKVRLDLNELAVESFRTTGADAEARGTVNGHLAIETARLECESLDICSNWDCSFASDCVCISVNPSECGTCATNCGTCWGPSCAATYCGTCDTNCGTCDPCCCCCCT